MSSRTNQLQLVICLLVDKQPIRLNVTFPTARIIPAQIMVAVLFGQLGGNTQSINNGLKQRQLISALRTGFKILLECGGIAYI